MDTPASVSLLLSRPAFFTPKKRRAFINGTKEKNSFIFLSYPYASLFFASDSFASTLASAIFRVGVEGRWMVGHAATQCREYSPSLGLLEQTLHPISAFLASASLLPESHRLSRRHHGNFLWCWVGCRHAILHFSDPASRQKDKVAVHRLTGLT
mmetsp:Transcript_40071/g.79005  ORF Transcript_40071/g.79005 Transcript_40071/m.79005 type:complete len:154 (+) Transcript_40071:1415-1876(+)